MPAQPPDLAVVSHLAASIAALTAGANLFGGPVRPHGQGVPLQAVFCLATGGPVNTPYFGAERSWSVHLVQVRVRSAPEKFAVGQALGRDCLAALHLAQLQGYTSCRVREPGPNYLGVDGNGCHDFSLNVELWSDGKSS